MYHELITISHFDAEINCREFSGEKKTLRKALIQSIDEISNLLFIARETVRSERELN
jgi:hypothetical protein